MCDAGTVSTTEPNALREVVEMEGWVDKLLGSINLPGYVNIKSLQGMVDVIVIAD
jgi:AP-3 complex subunit mu